MTRYLLDTNAAADCIFRRRGVDARVKQARLAGGKIGIAVPVMAELLAGMEFSASREQNLAVVNRHLSLFRLWPFTPEAARIFARLYAELRRSGRMVAPMDLMIASTALSLGNCRVITSDSDLLAVPGLKTENWAT
jgi:tRNA(fMet)-specific endonuclease VapC